MPSNHVEPRGNIQSYVGVTTNKKLKLKIHMTNKYVEINGNIVGGVEIDVNNNIS